MRTLKLAICMLVALTWTTVSSTADNRPQNSSNSNPIRLEGQIREITEDSVSVGDDVRDEVITIRLHRDRYPIVTSGATKVRWLDGCRVPPGDLRNGDSIRVEGNLERDVIVAEEITILLRIEHLGGTNAH